MLIFTTGGLQIQPNGELEKKDLRIENADIHYGWIANPAEPGQSTYIPNYRGNIYDKSFTF